MPKEIVIVNHACTVCGEEYPGDNSEQLAAECEAKHVRIKDVIGSKYLIPNKSRILHAVTNGKYAHTLKVEYEDGAVKTYMLDNSK